MFCAWCGTQVSTVSYAPCPRCGRPTNGAQAVQVPSGGGGNTIGVVIGLVVGGIVAVGILGILAAIAIPNLLTAMQRSKQKRTIADMRSLATAVEAYGTDNNGYPDATSIDTLEPKLSPKYISHMPRLDGWGHPMMYFCYEQKDGKCTGYVIGSGGEDGMFEHSEPRDYVQSPPGGTSNFNCDLIFSNGSFIEYPEGVQH